MSSSQQLMNGQSQQVNGALLEKVIFQNDLAGLSPVEKVQHIKNVCESLGLNPLTKPIQLLKFQGKEVIYASKDCTEQLRKNHKVSITSIDTKIVNDLYIVIANAATPDGRTDAATGVISISGLKGDALCNAMMKAETKSKRRVTLSICGLGFMDESEVESIPGATKVNLDQEQKDSLDIIAYDLENDIDEIISCQTVNDLEETYKRKYRFWLTKKDKDIISRIIQAKDKRKQELQTIKEFIDEINDETGEVIQ